jgi:phosphotransacetylase
LYKEWPEQKQLDNHPGLAAPVCDLSRGCSWEDIANTAVLVILMAGNK